MKIIESILTKNPCYQAGRKIQVKGLMLHSVGCSQPRAKVFVDSWNNSGTNVCVHGFVDGVTGEVYQTLPWDHRGWHCGSGRNGSANNTHTGVEMCEPACIRYESGGNFSCSDLKTARESVKKTYEAAVELFAYLCIQYGLDPLQDGVIISHNEGHARGIASNHGDPEHLWNGLAMGYTMEGFRKDIKAAMTGKTKTSTLKANPSTFRVRITTDGLNIRKGPGTKYEVTGCIEDRGVYTIVKVSKNGKWGKLKSGAGWISLTYTERV